MPKLIPQKFIDLIESFEQACEDASFSSESFPTPENLMIATREKMDAKRALVIAISKALKK